MSEYEASEFKSCTECGAENTTKGTRCTACTVALPTCPNGGSCATCGDEESCKPNIWALLEQDAPKGCDGVQSLYSWSLNYDAGKGPFALFLDLIGYSEEHYGMAVYSGEFVTTLGYVEIGKLAEALTEYSVRPADVSDYVSALMEAEAR